MGGFTDTFIDGASDQTGGAAVAAPSAPIRPRGLPAGLPRVTHPPDCKPFEGLQSSFANAPPNEAGVLLSVVFVEPGLDGHLSLSAEARGSLRAEVRAWIDDLRRRNEMASAQLRAHALRDEFIDLLAEEVVGKAAKSATGVWTAALPNGRQLAIVHQSLMDRFGIDELVRAVHQFAIRKAKEGGDQYSRAALEFYSQLPPQNAAVAAS